MAATNLINCFCLETDGKTGFTDNKKPTPVAQSAYDKLFDTGLGVGWRCLGGGGVSLHAQTVSN